VGLAIRERPIWHKSSWRNIKYHIFPLDIIEVYICFTEAYIVSNFESQILMNRCVIEKRIKDEDRSVDDFMNTHNKMRKVCEESNLKVFDVNSGYEDGIDHVMRYIDSQKKGGLI
jgi:hypothetical protein